MKGIGIRRDLMYWISPTTAVVTVVALALQCSLPTLAATGATIEGTVEIPCNPSRVSEVISVQIRSVSGESASTVAVDSPDGTFRISGLEEGEYELIAIGVDGKPLSPEPKRLLVSNGLNTVVLSMQPPGCGEQDSDRDGVPDSMDSCPESPPGTAVGDDGCPLEDQKKPGGKRGLKDWQITLIYVGVVGLIVLAVGTDDEEPASEF
jgi:hypothetical protein